MDPALDRQLRPTDVPRLRAGLRIVSVRDTLYAVQATTVRYLGSGDPDDYRALLAAIDGQRTMADVCTVLVDAFDAESVYAALSDLVGDVIDIAPRPRASPWSAELEASATEVLRARPILLLGDGALANAVSRRGATLELAALTHVAPRRVQTNRATDVELIAEDAAVPARLDGDASQLVDVLTQARLREIVASHDVVVCCLEGIAYDAILAVNRACLTEATPCVFVVADPDGVAVGPTLVPWRTPCFECAVRQLAFEPTQPDADELLGQLFAERIGDPAPHLHLLDTAANQAWCEVFAVLSEASSPQLHTQRIYVEPSGGRSARSVGPNTECNSCRGMNREGIRSAADVARLDAGPPPWGNRDAVDVVVGTRSHGVQEARRRAEAAMDALGVDIRAQKAGIPQAIARDYPALADLHYAYLECRQRVPYAYSGVRLHTQVPGMGKGPSAEQAWCSAAYEWIERCLGHYHGGVEVYRARYADVRDDAIDMGQLTAGLIPHYDFRQEPPFDADVEMDWVAGWSLVQERRVLVPAAIAYYHLARFRGGELALPRRSSSGVASGCELEDAVLQGLLEVVEHDAWFSAHMTGAACPVITLASIDDPISTGMVESVQRAGFDVQVRNLTNDLGIPVIEANLTNRRSFTQYLVSGWGSHLDPTIALRRALCEAVQCVCFGGHERERRNVVQSATSILRVHNERAQRVDRVGPSQRLRDIESLADGAPSALRFLRKCVASIRSALPQADVVFCDVTPVDEMGVYVTNTIVPGLTDAVDSFVHATDRLLRYRRIIEGDDAPVLTVEQLYLGERMH